MNPAIFLDKDGTLLVDFPYNVNPKRMRFAPRVPEGLRLLHSLGYRLIVITNQPGVAYGFYPIEALMRVQKNLTLMMEKEGVPLSGFYFCPHHPEGREHGYSFFCHCRKPRPGLIQKAMSENEVKREASWMVGDILNDIEAGRAAGVRTILIDNGNETEWNLNLMRRPHFLTHDFYAAAEVIAEASGQAHEAIRVAEIS